MQDISNPVKPPFFVVRRVFVFSLTLCNTSPVSHTIGPAGPHPSSAPYFKTFEVFLICFSKCEVMHDERSHAKGL
jgi:hypothetical protein